ncbi:hypothetical protein ACP4OV_016596 [Aristida adscensionis]
MSKPSGTNGTYDLLYPVEYLNTLSGNNFPQHHLILKKGALFAFIPFTNDIGDVNHPMDGGERATNTSLEKQNPDV